MKIAVTGHRPDKLGVGYNDVAHHDRIKGHMRSYLRNLNPDEVTLISGGALGVDQFWMEVGLELHFSIIAAIPFKGFDNIWPIECRNKLDDMLKRCIEVHYVSKHNSKQSYQQRNEWMVDNCDQLVAYWDGTKGGTANCVNYALQKKTSIIRFNPKEIV